MPKSKIPIRDEYRMSWEAWMRGRHSRRISGNKVAPEIIRRPDSKDDAHLRAAYDGERGPQLPTEAELKQTAEKFAEDS